jgi:hypothetical protein
MTTSIHSCSYYCTRPECVLAQRDELRAQLAAWAQHIHTTAEYTITTKIGDMVGFRSSELKKGDKVYTKQPVEAQEQALKQIALLAEYGTTGPGKCNSRALDEMTATALRRSISDIARAAMKSTDSGEPA